MFQVFLAGEMLQEEIAKKVLGGEFTKLPYNLNGYVSRKFHGKHYLVKREGANLEGIVCTLNEEQLWRLDQWKDVPVLTRVEIYPDGKDKPLLLYIANIERMPEDEYPTLERQVEIFERKLELAGCDRQDLFLLYPCAVKNTELHNDDEFVHSFMDTILTTKEHLFVEEEDEEELSEFFLNKLKQYNNEEFDGKFFRKIRRQSLGIVDTVVALEEEEFHQYGFAYLSIHPQTGVGMVGIVYPSISVPIELQLCGFCSDSIEICTPDGRQKVKDWMKERELDSYGSPKAIAFSYSPMTEREVLCCLACEMYPMGELIGDTMREWSHDNFAQYEIAEVYASDRCLIEISKMNLSLIKERLNVEAVELFFLELLVMQEAAIARVSDRTYEIFNEGLYMKADSDIQAKLFALSREAANAVLFVNYKKLRFPTVRISAKKIAERFGIAEEMENYQSCRQMLEQMIAINTSESEKVEGSLMNLLLLFLTMVQVLPLIAQLVKLLIGGQVTQTDIFASAIGAASCLSLYLIYRLSYRRAERKSREKRFSTNIR